MDDIRTPADGERDAGVHRSSWDGRDDAGTLLAPGLYLAKLDAGAGSIRRRGLRLQ